MVIRHQRWGWAGLAEQGRGCSWGGDCSHHAEQENHHHLLQLLSGDCSKELVTVERRREGGGSVMSVRGMKEH